MTKSNELYKELLMLTVNIPREFLFENQLQFGKINEDLYREMYSNFKRNPGEMDIANPKSYFQGINSGLADLCRNCSGFHYSARQNKIYDKQNDIFKASYFENTILNFLHSKGFKVVRGDESNQYVDNHKGYPDLCVLNESNSPACYIEVKYNAAPFIKVRNFVPGRECYEGSLTLNPQKLERQKRLIQDEIKVPVFYIYWADFPCLKGLFSTRIENIWNYYSSSGGTHQHDRRTGSGDFSYGRKTGQTEIIYPPILEMIELEDFINSLKQLV